MIFVLKRKGFTLIELLAVIIILAIVAIVATPIILNVINDARVSAGRSEAQMIYSGINNYCAASAMKNELDGSTDICADGVTIDDVKEMVSLDDAVVTKVTYNGDNLVELIVESNGHKFTLSHDGSFIVSEIGSQDEEIITGKIKDIVLSKFPYLETNENGCLVSNDNNYSYMGGCYLKGDPTDNYIWYSGFLWRIMGINADGSVRMIVDEILTVMSYGPYGSAFDYDNSNIKEWLNDYFYNHLDGNDILISKSWCSEVADSTTSTRATCTNNLSTEPAKIGLITVDEYNLAGGEGSYLDISQYQWTMTPIEDNTLLTIYYGGEVDGGSDDYNYGIRAIINVDSNAFIIGGNGTVDANWNSQNGPYILNDDKRGNENGKLSEKVTSGEYVLFADKVYRVVSKDANGNIKLILDDYYEEDLLYGSVFSTDSGIGQKLNTDVLEWLVPSSNTADRNKLVTNYTWYQNIFNRGDNYKISLEEDNPTRSINATVGLIRVGELLSGQSSSILTNGYLDDTGSRNNKSYWTLTSYDDIEFWYIHNQSFANRGSSVRKARPVIVVNSDVEIISGNGIWSNPYQI